MLRKNIIILFSVMMLGLCASSLMAFPSAGYDVISTTAEIDLYDPADSSLFVETITCEGFAVVWRDEPYDPGDGRIAIDTRMDTLLLKGFSPFFGDSVFITLERSVVSTGMIQQISAGVDFPAESYFDVHYQITFGTEPSPPFIGGPGNPQPKSSIRSNLNADFRKKQTETLSLGEMNVQYQSVEDAVNVQFPVSRAACTMSKGTGAAASYWDSYEAGTGTYTYFDPLIECGAAAYPYELQSISFPLYDDGSGIVWPAQIDIVVYDMLDVGDPCTGPGAELCRFAVTADQPTFGYPNVGTVSFPSPCCINGPVFIGFEYTAGIVNETPSILFDDNSQVDPCENWMLSNVGSFVDWATFWTPPPPGYPMFSVDGETQSQNCDPVLVPGFDPHMTDTIWQLPPLGREYKDPRKVPIIDPASGDTVGWTFHKHVVNPPPPDVDTVPTIGWMGIWVGPNPPAPTQPEDEIIQLNGDVILSWGTFEPLPEGGRTVQTEILSMDLSGESVLFGPTILQLPFPAPGAAQSQGGETWPMDSFFDVYYQVDFPALGQTIEPLQPPVMQAVIEAIPPQDVQFIDENPHPIHDVQNPGVIIGWVRPIHWVLPPDPTGACCDTATGGCRITTMADCNGANELYQGDGTVCNPNPCPIPEPDQDCFESTAQGTITLDPSDDQCLNGIDLALTSLFSQATTIELTPAPYSAGQTIQTEMVSMELSTVDPTFGLVIIRERADKQSLGEILVNSVDGSGELTSGDSFFDVFFEVELVDMGMLLNTGNTPLHIEASITELPPIQRPYFPLPSAPPLMLLDAVSGAHEGWLCHAEHLPTIPIPCDELRGACCDYRDGSCRITTAADCNGPSEVYSGDGTSCVPNECDSCTEWTAGVDTIAFSVFEIDVYDTDSVTVLETIIAAGTQMIVQRSAPYETSSHIWRMDTDIIQFGGSGFSPSLGPLTISLAPSPPSTGFIQHCDSCSDNLAESEFTIHFLIITAAGDTIFSVPAEMKLPCDVGWNPQSGGPGTFTPPNGHDYDDPRIVPIYDASGQLIGYIKKTHKVTPPGEVGACCFLGNCVILPAAECESLGGQYQGDGTVCDPNPCDQTCCLQRGDALHDNQLILVNDLVFLVNYVFKGGPSPFCLEEGDALADNGLILVNDLVFLVNYVFKGGPPPPPC